MAKLLSTPPRCFPLKKTVGYKAVGKERARGSTIAFSYTIVREVSSPLPRTALESSGREADLDGNVVPVMCLRGSGRKARSDRRRLLNNACVKVR